MPECSLPFYPSPTSHLTWSPAEKAIARKAFDRALQREFAELIRAVKERAKNISQPSDVWDLEEYMTQRRKRIDRTYDYRYSVLIEVFASLIKQRRLSEDELYGLAEEKITLIKRYVKLASQM